MLFILKMLGLFLIVVNIYHSDAVDAVLGSNANLTCSFLPGAWNRWISSGWTSLTNGQKYANVNTEQLIILNVQVDDSGDYVCNSATQTQVFHLNVLVNGGWSQWSGWSTCSVSCGYGTLTRSRSCNNPVPANGSNDCSGMNTESVSCNNGNCPVNGGWSQWSGWSTCSVTCGYGTLTRSRFCTNPLPANGGNDCSGSNTEYEACYKVNCPAKPSIYVEKTSYNAGIGQNIELNCMVVHTFPPLLDLWWTNRNGTRLNADRYRGGTISNPSLTITGLISSDSGYYYCNAQNSIGTSIASIQLSTGNTPSADIAPDYYVTMNGTVSITIVCQVTNGENLLWYKDNITLLKNNKYNPGNVNNSKLIIADIKTDDRGVYKCYVENIYGSQSDETLFKVVQTEIPNMTYENIANESVSLKCVIYDAMEVKWQHNNVRISTYTNRYSGGNITEPSLTITKLLRSDSGIYKCESSYDSVTSISTEIILRVRDKPLVQSSTQYVQTIVGGNVVIPCSFDSYPEPTNVFWKKDDMTLNSIDGVKYNGSSVQTPSLTIYNINNSHSGLYVCYVENELGISDGKPVKLDVQDASQSASIIGPVAGGVSGGIATIVLLAVGLLIWTKSRKRSTNKQNQDYETPDITKVELHLYEERQRHNSNAIELPDHGSTSENLSNMTFKTYNVQDFMELLQDKTSLNRNTKYEYQLLNVITDLKAAGDYEIIETTSGTATAGSSENKSLVKKQDDGNGYIIRTVPGQSDIDIFWTEISDFRARNTVLLVHKMEQISEFFPTTDVSVNTSKFKVELASSEKYPNNIFVFNLAVWNKDKKTEVQVKLYKTTDWKVGEKHPSIDTLCKILDVVSYQESGVVAFLESDALSFRVCGCLGVCHEVIYAIKAERGFNIPQVAVDLKRMRPYLFQTYEEYNLCYKIIGHFLENQTTYAVID